MIDPPVTYLSYIILGLVLCFGYLIYRAFSPPKRRDGDEWQGVEQALRDAEREARLLALERQAERREEEAEEEEDSTSPGEEEQPSPTASESEQAPDEEEPRPRP